MFVGLSGMRSSRAPKAPGEMGELGCPQSGDLNDETAPGKAAQATEDCNETGARVEGLREGLMLRAECGGLDEPAGGPGGS